MIDGLRKVVDFGLYGVSERAERLLLDPHNTCRQLERAHLRKVLLYLEARVASGKIIQRSSDRRRNKGIMSCNSRGEAAGVFGLLALSLATRAGVGGCG
jgi:hypothetical protein